MSTRGAPVVLALWLVIAGTVPAARADEPATNLQLMGRLTDSVIERLLAEMPDGYDDNSVTLVPLGVDERYEFLTNSFSRILTSRGIRTFTGGARAAVDSTGTNLGARGGVELQYQARDFTLAYPKIYRSFLIGGRKVKRTARVNLLAKLIDSRDRSVVWVGEATEGYEDQFAHKDLARVEAGLFEFTKPPKSQAKLGKIVEPVVVSGIIVGLIYLFFSNQDNN